MSAGVDVVAKTNQNQQNQHILDSVFDYPKESVSSSGVSSSSASGSSSTIDLTPLSNESSSYAQVCRAVQPLLQSHSSSSSSNSGNSNHSILLHDASYCTSMTKAWQHLLTCLQQHPDRRCRILAGTALATLGRTAQARIRPSPLLYSNNSSSQFSNKLEDEVCTDLPTALASAALEDPDDGVAASALHALGLLLLSSSNSPSDDADVLTGHVLGLCGLNGAAGANPYAPTLRSLQDEDAAVALQEMQARITENVLSPRMLPLLDRVLRLPQSDHVALALPVLTQALVHALLHNNPVSSSTGNTAADRITYSKRWSELDVTGLADTLVQVCLLPNTSCGGTAATMGSRSSSNCLALTSAVCALRLCAAAPTRHWVPAATRAAVQVLWEEISGSSSSSSSSSSSISGSTTTVASHMALLSTLVVALRGVPLHERTRTLVLVAQEIQSLPSTVPSVIASGGGLRLQTTKAASSSSRSSSSSNHDNHNHHVSFRTPARMALWTEVALSFFMDGPCETPRADSLQVFLNSPVISQLLAAEQPSQQQQVLSPRDELLLAFTTTAVQAGRRFRITADGALQVADPSAHQVQEWLALVWVVLTSFLPCAVLPIPGAAYLDENLSLLTAGLSSYVQLLQEYLHFVGLLHPSSSVALKLGANACPPHILWDRMTESAAFLSRFESMDLDALDRTTKLLDELTSRELSVGIPSHHMRLFVLALAADHWVQGRICGIRKQFEPATAANNNNKSTTPDALTLNMVSGREILRALAPKRLLAKIVKAHVPPVDSEGKPKRDPIKKLALESVRVSVACIENIALTACDWRRRFGSSQESKHIVSVAVGLLQGKVDETPVDDLMKSVMGPTCEAAVARIQAFYENAGQISDQSFPLSELVTQPVKIKIKPLVSSSKANARPKDDVRREYLMQLCRQIVTARTLLAVQASPPADSVMSPSRPVNWLRLAVPPMPESKDGRLYGGRSEAMSAWGHCVRDASAPSDPAQVIVAYTHRLYLRYDGEDDYRITVLMRAHNMTPIDFVEGLRLELGVAQVDTVDDENDPVTMEHIEALGSQLEDLVTDLPLASESATYKQELKSGEHITWEVTMDGLNSSNSLNLVPSVVYRNVQVEPPEAGANWIGEKANEGEGSIAGTETKSGEDDFQVTKSVGQSFKGSEAAQTHDVRLTGEPLVLPPLIMFQPCPLVFFSDRCGDADSFRFLWFRLPYQLAPMKIALEDEHKATLGRNPATQKIAKMSSLRWEGEAIPGGVATRLWAFMTLSGHRVFCVLTESDNPNTESEQTLYFRGDNQSVLFSLAGSKPSRISVVSSLLPGLSPVGAARKVQ